MVDTPRSDATRPIDTAWRPSVAATRTAAATIRSRLRAGRGPLLGRVRTPQAASMLAGRPVARWSSIASASGGLTSILRLCIPYAIKCICYAEGAAMTGERAIEATGLEKSYGDLRVLDGVDLAVDRGSVFALLGPNGAGKTTAVRILATLVRADAGRARAAGFDVVADPRQVRRRAAELLERFDLAEAGARTVKTWSGGMRRRLDLAAGLVGRPSVIFLDEPTTGLDPRGRQAVWQVISGLAG